MATNSFAIRKSDDADAELGTFTFEQLRVSFARGEITEIDFVRDADAPPPAKWKRIKELPALVAKLRSSDPKGAPVASPGSRDTALNLPAPVRATTPGASPAGVDVMWFRKDLLPVIVASLALLLTLINTGWLLLANADADEPRPIQLAAQSVPTPSLTQPSPAADGPRPDEPTTAKAKTPRNNGDDDARKTAPRPQKQQGATLDEVMKRLDRIDSRITAIDQRAATQSSKVLFCRAIEAGALEFSVADTAFRFIFVPAGTFRFGYPADEQNRVVQATGNPNSFLNATPECVVTVQRGFFILDREITVAHWNSCTENAAAQPVPAATGQPQTSVSAPKRNVSWLDAHSFCSALQKAVPQLSAAACEVRLPTEIEWEYAGRGGQSLIFPWVPQPGAAQLFLGSAKGTAAPIAVDPRQNMDRSWRGLFDFAGNVSEWCLDEYEQSLHEALADRQADAIVTYDPADDPLITAALAVNKGEGNPSRALRGGSILDAPEACELPMRRFLLQNKAAEHIGFRPVIVLKKTGSQPAEDTR